jgi:glycosyltransferase involved in cell wall biosynthesis
MKQIVLIQGIGNNERGWADLMSNYGRVLLIQQGYTDHVECWEKGQRVLMGPEINTAGTRYFDNLTFGSLSIFRALRAAWKHTRGEKIDLVIGSSYAMALAALLLRLSGKARKMVCNVTDHLPVTGGFGQRLHRRIAGGLTWLTARFADEVWGISPRLPALRFNPHSHVLPFPIDDNAAPLAGRAEVAYIGFPSPDHALDWLFEICRKHELRLNIIGDSPYLRSIRELAPPQTVFHGQMTDREKVKSIFSRCFCGYAIYRMTGPQSYSYYGFPSKCFYFFANNVPLLTTNTSAFAQEVEKNGIGRLVEPAPDEIERAILDFHGHFPAYFAAIDRFRETWNAGVQQFHRERLGALLGETASAPARPAP